MGLFDDVFDLGCEVAKIAALPLKLIDDKNISLVPTITTDYQDDYPEDKRDYERDE